MTWSLNLALAVIGRPDVVFLDEPTAGVDVAGRQLIRDLIRSLADDGVTVMLTKRIGAFAQYRFTHFTTELEYQNTTPALATEIFKTTYDTHHAIAGLSLRF